MTHERRQNILLFLQGFVAVTLMGLGLLMMLRTAATGAGWADVGPLLVAMAIIVTGGILLAPGLAQSVASPLGRLFYPNKPLEPQPLLSLARSLRQNGQFVEAMKEYRKVVAEFPDYRDAYFEMIDMAVRDMDDHALGREVLLKALVAVDGEASRRELRDCFDCALAVRKAAQAKPARIAFDLFEEDCERFDGE